MDQAVPGVTAEPLATQVIKVHPATPATQDSMVTVALVDQVAHAVMLVTLETKAPQVTLETQARTVMAALVVTAVMLVVLVTQVTLVNVVAQAVAAVAAVLPVMISNNTVVLAAAAERATCIKGRLAAETADQAAWVDLSTEPAATQETQVPKVQQVTQAMQVTQVVLVTPERVVTQVSTATRVIRADPVTLASAPTVVAVDRLVQVAMREVLVTLATTGLLVIQDPVQLQATQVMLHRIHGLAVLEAQALMVTPEARAPMEPVQLLVDLVEPLLPTGQVRLD